MKKWLALVLLGMFCATVMVGCGNDTEKEPDTEPVEKPE